MKPLPDCSNGGHFGSTITNKMPVLLSAAACLSFALCTSAVRAAAFGQGDLVVVLDGDGSAALNANATAAFLQEYSIAGSLIQTLALPTAASSLNQTLTLSGSAASEGFLTLSVDGQYLTVAGYAATPGTAGVTTAAASAINRVVGTIAMSGNINTTTALGGCV